MSESDIRSFFCIFAIGLIIGFQVQGLKFQVQYSKFKVYDINDYRFRQHRRLWCTG